MHELIIQLADDGYFSSLDLMFGKYSASSEPIYTSEVEAVAMLVSANTARGNICLVMDQPFYTDNQPDPVIQKKDMISLFKTVQKSPLFSFTAATPFVIQNNRMYLSRYFEYEQKLSAQITARASRTMNDFDEQLLSDTLARLFPSSDAADWQKAAACSAVLKNFSVITGGPGTGKTTTVVKIMALLHECGASQKKNISIALCAPTGKAAARLSESIKMFKSSPAHNLPLHMIDSIADSASTIHRLLKFSPSTQSFSFSEKNHLPYDVVIIDEASMIDCALMSKCIGAVRHDARIILLGDKEQLSSVEPGHVLGDICAGVNGIKKSSDHSDSLYRLSGVQAESDIEAIPLADAVTVLQKSYRFNDAGGIGAVSASVKAGDADRAFSSMKQFDFQNLFAAENTASAGNVFWHDMTSHTFKTDGEFEHVILPYYQKYFDSANDDDWFRELLRFKILSPVRSGVCGVEMLNEQVENILASKKIISRKNFSRFYPGLPLMATQNDYAQNLFNGDVGIVLPDNENNGVLKTAFQRADKSIRRIAPERIAGLETVYAMTVHKSQGSEFETVVLILPPVISPVLTRELVYTALTRAKNCVHIFTKKEVFTAALSSTASRTSGLREALWGKQHV